MSKNITLLGQNYIDVPGIQLPQTNGEMAYFSDTSDATATATEILSGYTAYGADGTKITGTASGAEEKEEPDPLDVDIIDYDGTLLYAYTVDQFLQLESLPENPSHTGLIAQGWNWTLADAKDFVGKYGALVVGQNYTTDDGRTRIYIHVPENQVDLGMEMQVNYTGTVKNGSKVYWGDGSESIWNKNANANGYVSHIYTESGDYIIEIEVLDGSISFLGRTGANSSIVGGNPYSKNGWVQKIEIGDNVTGLAQNTFKWMSNLKSISIPITVVTLNDYDENIFHNCASLGGVVFPINFTTNRYRAFFPQYAVIKYVSIPKGMHNFQMSSYPTKLRKLTMYSLKPYNGVASTVKLYDVPSLTHYVVMGTYQTVGADTCRSSMIKKLFLPESVTRIDATAFAYNVFMKEVHLYPTTPPTLNNVNAFNGRHPDCIFYVPYSADHSILQAYQNATNWSTFSANMQEESIRSISVLFNSGNINIYNTDLLSDLRQYLTVTALYSDQSTRVIKDYKLKGSLETGVNTITVNYMNQETTFTVTAIDNNWNLIWNSSSEELPTGMTTASYDFTTEAGILKTVQPTLTFDDYIGDADLRIQCKWDSSDTKNNYPQIALRHDTKSGFRAYARSTTNTTKIETNVMGYNLSTGYSQNEYHIIHMKGRNGFYSIEIDGELFDQGAGVLNDNTMNFTGIKSNAATDVLFIKSIRFKKINNS